MDKELERLKKEYPIGSKIIYKSEPIRRKLHYYNDDILKIYKELYGNKITILDDCTVQVEYINENYVIVNGYLYTKDGWNLVQNAWDGFIIIEEPNKKKGN